MTKLDLLYVQHICRGGRAYHYFRRPGFPRARIPGAPGSREFADAYDALMKQEAPPVGAGRAAPGSMRALAAAWYASASFTGLKAPSQRTYRRLLEAFLEGREDRQVAALEPRHLLAILDARSKTPAQANALLNVLRRLLQFAFERGWRKDNPARDVKRLRYARKPYATWTEEDIAAFEAKWPVGTRARLALALLLYTAQRRSDVIRMGRQHVRGGSIDVAQQKTGARLSIPVHPALREAIAAHPNEHLTFLVTQAGEPFTATGFYNWFVACAAEAGLPKGLSPHGLRKAASRRLADAGCTPHQIMAITGHATIGEVERYTRAANQKHLAQAAVTRLSRPPKRRT